MPDSRGFLLPSEKDTLLKTYAPVLILFPEDAAYAPYPDEGDAIYTIRGSYHPRSVEIFLQRARIRYRRRIILRNPLLFFYPRPLIDEVKAIQRAIKPDEIEAALQDAIGTPGLVGLPADTARHITKQRLIQERLADRIRGFDLPLYHGFNLNQWQAYFEWLKDAPAEASRSVIYGRVVQGLAANDDMRAGSDEVEAEPLDVDRSRVALQYWFHYYYDDWANRHEGDWESITILLQLNQGLLSATREIDAATLLAGVTALDVGYAAHEDGYRRLWRDVQKTETEHPIVYVARGSSASYFAWRLSGYPASARVGFAEKLLTVPGLFVGGQRFLGRRWDARYLARFTARGPKNTDWVAADPKPADRHPADAVQNMLERLLPDVCQGVRRYPDFGTEAGYDDTTYHLETNDLFWLEMVQAYGIQWGENALFPGTKGPRGLSEAKRASNRRTIQRLARLESIIDSVLEQLQPMRIRPEAVAPELHTIFLPLQPKNLRRIDALPRIARAYVYSMWAWVLREHPEAWRDGPGWWLRWKFWLQLRPGWLPVLRFWPRPRPLLDRRNPVYHVKTLLFHVRQTRYDTQELGAKWDNPFAWVRHTCQADTYYYGRDQSQDMRLDFRQIDCFDRDTPGAQR